ncbi:MAG: DUF4816 domain-containing protein [Actinomycetia bacterium]|nr:DUF4816 domain-containing protein [Actinomycetes bacterium]
MKKHRIAAGVAAMISATLMLGGVMTAPAHAADQLPIPPGATPINAMSGSNGFTYAGWNIAKDCSGGATDVTIWHLVDSGSNNASNPPIATTMVLQFNGSNDNLCVWDASVDPLSTNGGGNNPSWVIITPMGWKLTAGYLSPYALGIFNVSSQVDVRDYQKPKVGSLTVSAPDAQQSYTLDTYQPYWQKTLQPYWQRVLQPVWQKTLQPVWQKTLQPYWQKTYQPVWQRTYQPYDAPVYKMDVSTGGTDTLVTRLAYSDNTSSATPTNGGVFKNGHTYVTVDVAAASAGKITYTIADSSYNSNGKKTPAEYNRPIAYQYYVSIANGKLTISFDDRLISASVGAYLACSVDGFPGNAPKHVTVTTGQTASFALPSCSGGKVLLYTHFEGNALSWYTTGVYKQVGWQVVPSKTELVSDVQVDYKLVSDKLVRTDTVADKYLRTDVVKDAWLRTDVVSDKLAYTTTVSDVLVRSDLVSSETKYEAYAGDFAVSVADAAGTVVCQGATLSACATVDGLKPGAYTVTLTGSDAVAHSMTVTVLAGTSVAADFTGLVVATGETRTVDLEKIYLDPIVLEKIYLADIVRPKIYAAPIVLPKIYADPITLDKKYLADVVLPKTYLADKFLPAIHLGDEFAIYLNGPKKNV